MASFERDWRWIPGVRLDMEDVVDGPVTDDLAAMSSVVCDRLGIEADTAEAQLLIQALWATFAEGARFAAVELLAQLQEAGYEIPQLQLTFRGARQFVEEAEEGGDG